MSNNLNLTEADFADFAILDEEFLEFSMEEDEFGEEGLGALQELEQELASTSELGDDLSAMSIAMLTDDPQEMLFFFNYIKKRARKAIHRLVALVRRHGPRLAKCVPAVTAAVVLFKKGKYIAALSAAYRAYKCIKKAL